MPDAYSLAAMGMQAPDSVKWLVDHFDQDRKVFLSPDYTVEQLCAELLGFLCWSPISME